MMWPLLTKGPLSCVLIDARSSLLTLESCPLSFAVQYERMPMILGSSHVYRQIVISLFLNWIVGPFVRPVDANSRAPQLTYSPFPAAHARLGVGNAA